MHSKNCIAYSQINAYIKVFMVKYDADAYDADAYFSYITKGNWLIFIKIQKKNIFNKIRLKMP